MPDLMELKAKADKAEKDLTKARGAKYTGSEGPARESAKEIASALKTLTTTPTSKAAITKLQVHRKALLGIVKKLHDAKDQAAALDAIEAAKDALDLVAPEAAPVVTIEAASEADTIRKLVPPEVQQFRSLAARLAGALRGGSPFAIEQVSADIIKERGPFSPSEAGFEIATALLSLTGEPPKRPDWVDERKWNEERGIAGEALGTWPDNANKFWKEGVGSLAARAIIALWQVSRNPLDDGAKAVLKEVEPLLREEARKLKGKPVRGTIEDLADSVKDVIDKVQDENLVKRELKRQEEEVARARKGKPRFPQPLGVGVPPMPKLPEVRFAESGPTPELPPKGEHPGGPAGPPHPWVQIGRSFAKSIRRAMEKREEEPPPMLPMDFPGAGLKEPPTGPILPEEFGA